MLTVPAAGASGTVFSHTAQTVLYWNGVKRSY